MLAALALAAVPARAASLGISSFTVTPGAPAAAGHQNLTLDTVFSNPSDKVDSLTFHLPPGLVGNPRALPTCTEAAFDTDSCAASTQVGTVSVSTTALGVTVDAPGQVFNLVPHAGQPALLGTWVEPVDLGIPLGTLAGSHVEAAVSVRPGDYGLDTTIAHLPQQLDLLGGIIPTPITVNSLSFTLDGSPGGHDFLTFPSSCQQATVGVNATSNTPGVAAAGFATFTPTGCGSVPFAPGLSVGLESARADTPSGYTATLTVPDGDSTVRRATVVLPQGTVLSPSSAVGMSACTDAQFGVGSSNPAGCPANSQLGTATIVTPLVDHPLQGKVFLGQPTPTQLLRLFVDIEDSASGLTIKLPGVSTPDPSTGQLTTAFDNLPQVPFTSFALAFRGGTNAILSNPQDCGSYTATAALSPWSGGAAASPHDSFSISDDGAGAACPATRTFVPTVTDTAASTAADGDPGSLAITVNRPDRDQRLRSVRFSLPPGLLGRVAGVSLCPEADAASANCPADTRAGTVTATVGTGPAPATLSGPVYMGGPYKGGLLSLIAALPAKVGPLDLGTTVLRSAISLRSTDGGLDVSSDDLPRFVQGIPVDVRSLTVDLDKPGTLLNPTDCSPLSIGGTLTSVLGTTATASAPFQATGCDRLPFAPSISAVAGGKGNTTRGKHPMLRAIVGQPIDQARIASTTVTLPKSLGVVLNQVCTLAQADAGNCPAGSQVGTATAVTPLLPLPLSGPVYLIQATGPGGGIVPGVLVQLRGLVNLTLRGQVSVQPGGGLINRFDGIPDVPISRFELDFTGGKKGSLGTARDLCRGAPQKLSAAFVAHNGAIFTRSAAVGVQGCRPVVTASLRHAKSTRPKLLMSFREPAASTAVKQLTIKLPATLSGVKSRARRGVHLVAGKRRLGRGSFRLSGHTLVLKKLPAGTHVLKLSLSQGAIKPRRTLRRRALSGKPTLLRFGIQSIDSAGAKSSFGVNTRAKS
ncbi:MAG TPA: hypothetical protein VGF74_15015 [Thermoleophilaceae bacterium]